MNIQVYRDEFLKEVTDIFFLTTNKKEFKDQNEKEKFFEKYLGRYLREYTNTTYVFIDENKVIGYLAICPDTENFIRSVEKEPVLLQFKEFYKIYPAHLHINVSSEAQGKHVGSKLLEYGMSQVSAMGVPGVHLITFPSARNVRFYLKNGFKPLSIKELVKVKYQLLGKKI